MVILVDYSCNQHNRERTRRVLLIGVSEGKPGVRHARDGLGCGA